MQDHKKKKDLLEKDMLRKDTLKDTLQGVSGYFSRNRRRRTWKKVIGALACVVVFCTTYALILPAITMEKTPPCGKTEHTHSEACYAQETAESGTVPVCTPESLNLHRHTESCKDENGQYVCGYADFVVHSHNTSCYDAEGKLWCPFPEIKVHTHGEGCYVRTETEQVPVHTHTDACYTTERGELNCQIPEGEGAHTHSKDAGCYDENDTLVCQLEESAGHQHSEECYAHTKVLTCQLSAEPEKETNGQSLICDKEEIILHKHTDDCFDQDDHLICGKTEVLEHVHSDACLKAPEMSEDSHAVKTVSCGLEEHTHSDACNVIGLIEALPDQQSVEEKMAAFEETGDEAGSDAYLAELKIQVQEAADAYAALSAEEQAKVTNIDRLTALEWLNSQTQAGDVNVTVTNDDNSTAAVTAWNDNNNEAKKRLQAALFAVDQGYTIQSIEYYIINGLTGNNAAVKYNSGGLSAANGAQMFVYDLGADGMATPKGCAVGENPVKNEQTSLFTDFSFEIPPENKDTSHVYAFISAKPATLEDMGIYLGKKLEDGHWIAMDGPDEASANVKIDIQLTGNLTALSDHYPFILKVNEGEDFYPNEDAVRRAVGEVNDVQCYKIHWVEKMNDGTYNFQTGMELGNGKNSKIQLEYLKDDAQLKGVKGGRKLRVFSSKSADGRNLVEISNSVQNVQLMEENYKGFTFNVTEPCPYVFVSEKVEQGYIDALSIQSVIDGSDPFDNNDSPGYDSSPGNKIVRSYDTIQYNLEATFGARQEDVTAKTVNMYFELTLRKSATAAKFDTSKMLWLHENYSVEYLDSTGEVIMIMAHDGKYYPPQRDENGAVVLDEHGFAQVDRSQPPISVNSRINGSLAGKNSYKVASGGVAMQRLVGWTTPYSQGGREHSERHSEFSNGGAGTQRRQRRNL